MDFSQLAQWRATFPFFDRDGDGLISFKDAVTALREIAPNLSTRQLERSLSATGECPHDSIDFTAFVRLLKGSLNIQGRSSPQLKLSEIRQVFQTMDLDFSGYLTAAKIRHFLTNLNIHVKEDEMAEMVRMYDADGNGQISLDEFGSLVKACGYVVVEDEPFDSFEAIDDSSDASSDASATTDELSFQAAEDVVGPSKIICLDSLPDEARQALKLFDLSGSGVLNLDDLQCADTAVKSLSHSSDEREKRGLGSYVHQVNHIALIVSDVGKSAEFYSNVMGFRQIRRPNFDAHGAWFTRGNIELHLIKGIPTVSSGDDLIVNHISIETEDIDKIPALLRQLGVPFEQNVSVPKGKDGGCLGTNTSNSSEKIVEQYFIRDPDGYYIEICNCDVLTDYCLSDASKLNGYHEVEPLSLSIAAVCVNWMQEWSNQGRSRLEHRSEMLQHAARTGGSSREISRLLGCTESDTVDETLLQNFTQRMSIYGDICQNGTREILEEVLRLSGNDPDIANEIVSLKAAINGCRTIQPPPFYENGNILIIPPPIKIDT